MRYNVNKRRYKNNHYKYLFIFSVVKSYLYYSHFSPHRAPLPNNNKSIRRRRYAAKKPRLHFNSPINIKRTNMSLRDAQFFFFKRSPVVNFFESAFDADTQQKRPLVGCPPSASFGNITQNGVRKNRALPSSHSHVENVTVKTQF